MRSASCEKVSKLTRCEKKKDAKKNMDTPLKFNMEPEHGGLEDDFPFQLGAF